MNYLKQNGGRILLLVGEALVGVLLLIDPTGFTKIIIMAAGILLTITGILQIISYFKSAPTVGAIGMGLSRGLLETVGGCFCIFDADWFVGTFPILAILYGLAILVVGIVKVETTVDLIRLKNHYWFVSFISAIVTIACAIVIIANPFSAVAAIWLFIGVTLIIEALIDIASLIFSTKKSKPIISDAKIEDADVNDQNED